MSKNLEVTQIQVEPLLVHPLLLHNMQYQSLHAVGGPVRDSRWKAELNVYSICGLPKCIKLS